MPRADSRPLRCLLLSAVLLVLGAAPADAPPASLRAQIEALLNAESAGPALWGVHIADAQTGRTVYSRNADLTLMPASNQKLLTTAVALLTLGADYRYQTTLHLDGEADGGTLRGDLILEGSGDPTFGSRTLDGPDPLKQWAEQLADMGITRIEGRLIGDDDVFEDDPYAEGWDVSFVGEEAWAAPAGGLSYRDNLVKLKLAAEQSGRAPTTTMEPDGYLTVHNKGETRGRARRLRIERPFGQEVVHLVGSAPRGYASTVMLPVHDPTALTLHAFRQHLQAAGIEVGADLVDVDDLDGRLDYDAAEPLFVYASPPMREMLRIINKKSNNFYAEQVFRTFGWGGTAEGGGQRVKETLGSMGVSVAGLSVADGSGLSRKDMVTPRAMTELLVAMYDRSDRDQYLATLPRGGEDRTTMEYRLAEVPVQAKTGSLKYVRALSGYVAGPNGQPLAFSVFANHYSVPSYRIMQTIDAVVETLSGRAAG